MTHPTQAEPRKGPVSVRLPSEAREWLEREARAACRSISGQILFMIERAREKQQEEKK